MTFSLIENIVISNLYFKFISDLEKGNSLFQEYALSLELQISKEEQQEQQRLWDEAKVFSFNYR